MFKQHLLPSSYSPVFSLRYLKLLNVKSYYSNCYHLLPMHHNYGWKRALYIRNDTMINFYGSWRFLIKIKYNLIEKDHSQRIKTSEAMTIASHNHLSASVLKLLVTDFRGLWTRYRHLSEDKVDFKAKRRQVKFKLSRKRIPGILNESSTDKKELETLLIVAIFISVKIEALPLFLEQ